MEWVAEKTKSDQPFGPL